MARCISLWAVVEAHYAQTLAFSLKGNSKVAMDMYLAITSAGAQSAALKAAMRALPPKYSELFEAIWLLGKPLAGERHKLAHWLLGYSPTIKSLLLMDPRDGLKHLAENVAIASARKKKKEFVPLAPGVIRVLSNKYLNQLAKEIEHYGAGLSMFVGLLRIKDQSWADKQYGQLCNDPKIHAAILRVRGPQKTTA